MASRSTRLRPILAVILGITIVLIALPRQWKGFLPGFIRNPALHLGLDLVGGTQLDFRISEEEIQKQLADLTQQEADKKANGGTAEEINRLEQDRQSVLHQEQNLVEAIRTVLERRINALGVSEATITPSYVGNEKHLLVECPGVVDTQECIKVVGKTIQLEFKEELTETTTDIKTSVRAAATSAMRRITESGVSLQTVGQDLGSTIGVSYQESHILFKDELPKGLESLWGATAGKVVMKEGSVDTTRTNDQGQDEPVTVQGVFLVEPIGTLTSTGRTITEAQKAFALLAKTETGATYALHEKQTLDSKVSLRVSSMIKSMKPGELKSVTMDDGSAKLLFLQQFTAGQDEVNVSHILVTFAGASGAPASVTRTRQEALTRIHDIQSQLAKGVSFESLARSMSDGPSAKNGGSLGLIPRGTVATSFDAIAFGDQTKIGVPSDVIETPYGYHIIRTNAAPITTPDVASYVELSISGTDAPKRAADMIARLQAGKVRSIEPAMTMRSIFFSFLPSPWKDTPLDGKHFRSAAVTVDPVTNIPLVQILFDDEGAKLFQELTAKNVGKRIAIFVGGQLISAPTVQQEISGGTAVITGSRNFDEASSLAQDLNTGAIPAPIYLVGQYTIEATLGAAALHTSLLAALIGTILLMIYMIIMYKGLGVIADIALSMYAIMLFAILKLPLLLVTKTYIVLTLAGMAGIILSIGLAVDANVLVFERMKEELRKGKGIKTAVETSFVYAWPAIRDSNISALITCSILFLIGTSIVRGFAITLGMGVLLSLFTAVTLTRRMLRKAATLKIVNDNPTLFCAPKGQVSNPNL